MEEKEKFIYFLIRIPKSGSTSLSEMFKSAYPNNQFFTYRPHNTRNEKNLIEKFRKDKNYILSVFKKYGCFTQECVINKINSTIKPNDVIGGHVNFRSLPDIKYEKRLITLVRNPIDRIISEYNYGRLGFDKRNFIQKLYNKHKIMAASKYNLEGYLQYISENETKSLDMTSNYVLPNNYKGDPFEFMLENYFSFGSIENIDKFKKDFYNKTNILLKSKHSNMTESKKIKELNRKELSLLENLLAKDIELYNKILAYEDKI